MNWRQRRAHIAGMKAALDVHRFLRTDMSRQIDVFGAAIELGVTIGFRPLGKLAGAYLPAAASTGWSPGVIINSKHPRSKQRFTAAHELGHHLHDDHASVDIGTELVARGIEVSSERELLAEAFAAWFLMPRELVDNFIRRLHIGSPPSAVQVYQLSLALGTSYSAATTHLRMLHVLQPDTYQRYRLLTPKMLKEQTAVVGPATWHQDVWRIQPDAAPPEIYPAKGDEVVIELAETPSSGYRWRPSDSLPGFAVAKSTFHQADLSRVGSIGLRILSFRATEPIAGELRIVKSRAFDGSSPLAEFRLPVGVDPTGPRNLEGDRELEEAHA
jgi:predicted secreted protein